MSSTTIDNEIPGARSFLAELLAEQRSLTAVEAFAERHQRGQLSAVTRYHALLPTRAPAAGEQYAFEVDLDRCSGCKACVTACHSLNGLDAGESWRTVGTVLTLTPVDARPTTITASCHHCLEPGCLQGCPVEAYEKEPDTGIVRHLDDQCIGCQYCILKCPYEVPRYNAARGIVRKCDMCTQRLSHGEAPACAQACPNEAIRITLITSNDLRTETDASSRLVPTAPLSSHSLPTTRYVTARRFSSGTASDDIPPGPPHWPLIVMLLLTQASAGGFVMGAAVPALGSIPYLPGINLGMLLLGLGASVFHLGRPLGAWRFFLGLRHSWLSREILAFQLFAMAAFVSVVPRHFDYALPFITPGALGIAVAVVGLMAMGVSAMVYIDTPRAFWKRQTVARFAVHTVSVGAVQGLIALTLFPNVNLVQPTLLALTVFALSGAVWIVDARMMTGLDRAHPRTARCLLTHYPMRLRGRLALGLVGLLLPTWGTVIALASGSRSMAFALACLGSAALLGSALLEKYFFFTAVAADRMPGAQDHSTHEGV